MGSIRLWYWYALKEVWAFGKDFLLNKTKQKSSSVKHGRGHVMAWACIAAFGTGSVIFFLWWYQNECVSLQKHAACQFIQKSIQIYQEKLYYVARQLSKTHCYLNKGLYWGLWNIFCAKIHI